MKLYFTFYQKQVVWPPEINNIFEWDSDFVFKGAIGGFGGWVLSGFGGGGTCRSVFASVFLIIFVLYLNDIPSEAFSSTPSILSL